MPLAEWLLLRLEILLALGGLAGAAKSAYNGWVRRHILSPLDRIEHISEQVDQVEGNQQEMAAQQELLTDAVVALGESHEQDEREFDVDRFRREAGRVDRSEDLLDD